MTENREHGTDTPTGTDPDATWSEPGYEDKSLGQAVDQDADLADFVDLSAPTLAVPVAMPPPSPAQIVHEKRNG